MVYLVALYVAVSWLIAAHFLRTENLVLTGLCLAAPLLFFARRRWTVLALQGLAYLAGIVWLATAWQIVSYRRDFGEPWGRSAVILLSVAVISALAGLLLRGPAASKLCRAT